ncbi:TIGR03089 family protein [Williamsia sp.]|uniref:TIGR03089 family protein n=1 Tax=Williamsia sp. TaxID=1872085 RepID=UPI002F920928
MITLADAALDPALTRDGTQPLLTYYNDATGERTELSGLTAANWAAKTANMIRDEFGLMPGDVVAVDLPAHWQTAGVLLGAWWAGMHVRLGYSDDAALAFCSMDSLDGMDQAPEIAVVSLDPFGMPLRNLPIGLTDYAASVRVHGDQFRPSGPADPALDDRTVAEIVAAATASAGAAAIVAGSRVLSTGLWDTTDNLIVHLLTPLIAGGSLVQVAHPDESKLPSRAATEKVTTTLS